MKLSSTAFDNGNAIPRKYGCDGENAIPPLAFSDVPKNAKSMALIVDDPDAPAGVWDHWLLFNIPPDAKGVREGIEPEWQHCKNSFGKTSWGGPCPPDKEHQYFFKLYALDDKLDLREGADKKALMKAMEGHILAKAELTGRYKRPWT